MSMYVKDIVYLLQGSTLEVYDEETDRTNAFLVYGFSDTTVRAWVSSSTNGGVLD